MREITSTTNLTNPGVEPVDGDMIRIDYDDGTYVEQTFTSEEQTVPEEPIRVITVAAFMDRMDASGKLATIYQMIDQGRQGDPPDYTLFTAMENLKRREYINLDDPRLPLQIQAIGIYTQEEIDAIFVDGVASEEPETI